VRLEGVNWNSLFRELSELASIAKLTDSTTPTQPQDHE
jgi:hypothetical protein